MRIFYWLSYCGTSSAEILVTKFNKNHQNIIYPNSSLNIEEKRILLQFLLHTNMDAGHGGASGRFEALKEIAMEYAFLLYLEKN